MSGSQELKSRSSLLAVSAIQVENRCTRAATLRTCDLYGLRTRTVSVLNSGTVDWLHWPGTFTQPLVNSGQIIFGSIISHTKKNSFGRPNEFSL